jgi:hypothetical protein
MLKFFLFTLFIVVAGHALLGTVHSQSPFKNQLRPKADLYWESDTSVTGSPASAWASIAGSITLSQATSGNRPAVISSAFGTTQGLTFDGTNDALSYSGQAITRTGAASLSVVFKTGSSVTGPFVLISQADSSVANTWWEFGIAADGKLYIEYNNAGTKQTVEGSTVLSTSTAYNAILTYDGTDFYLLLNNVEENPLVITNTGTFAWLGAVSGTPLFGVGATMPSEGATRFFNGVIGGVYFWNRDLTR